INVSTGKETTANEARKEQESRRSHNRSVKASDPSGAFSSQDFTIQVTDAAPSVPSDANGATNSIVEGAGNGTAVGITASSSDIKNGRESCWGKKEDGGGGRSIE